MEPVVESIYLNELGNECANAIAAVERMNVLLEDASGSLEFFREATDLLQHAAAVSRLIWPPRNRNESKDVRARERGRVLRERLGISDDEHILKTRRLRDHLEHYDERIDDWVETSRNRNIVDHMIGPRSAIGGDAIGDSDIMRMYDPESKSYVFRGEAFNVQDLVSGVVDVATRVASRRKALPSPWNRSH